MFLLIFDFGLQLGGGVKFDFTVFMIVTFSVLPFPATGIVVPA
jgi:hypothetical protein